MKASAIIRCIKNTTIVSKMRAKKWRAIAQAELLTRGEVNYLEKNPEKIQEALQVHLLKFPDKLETVQNELDGVYHHSELANNLHSESIIKQDMLFWHYAYGFTFNEYVCYRFCEKPNDERKRFYSDRGIVCLCYDVNDLRSMELLNDKAETYRLMKDYYKREAISITSEADYDNFCYFVDKHKVFCKKLVREACGRSVELIDRANINTNREDLFHHFLLEGKTILEEVVVQSDDIAQLNKTSVNTLRCITLNNKDQIVAPFFFMKAGRDGSFIDNGAAGGLLIAVDKKTGILGSAIDEYGTCYSKHPDNGLQLQGFQLPDWEQASQLCCEMAKKFPKCGIIGWDLAHTDQGWVLIEGNSMTEAIGPQCTQQRGMREEIETFFNR